MVPKPKHTLYSFFFTYHMSMPLYWFAQFYSPLKESNKNTRVENNSNSSHDPNYKTR